MNRYLPIVLGTLTFVWGCQPTTDSTKETESFGRFDGSIVASWNDDGRHMTLREPFAYIDPQNRTWLAPAGATVDGASIPSAFWTLIGGPFEGKYRSASVVHDVGCVEMKQSWEDVHWMFYEACRCAGVSESEAKMLYYAVYHFGPRWQPVTETTVEQVQTADGQVVDQEVTVEHTVRIDPLPPTTTELEQVKAFVLEEDPAPQEIEKFTRDSLYRRPHRGNGHQRSPETSGEPTAESSAAVDANQPTNNARPNFSTRGWQRPSNIAPNNYAGNRPNWPNQRSFEGTNQRPNYSGNRSGMPLPALTHEEEQWTTEIVRQHIDQQSPEPRQANYTTERIRGGYRVFVQFLQQDESGQWVPTEGGQYTVRLSRQGAIMEMVSGTASNLSRPLEAQREIQRDYR